MLVDHVGRLAGESLPREVVVSADRRRAGRRDELYLWMLLAHDLCDREVAVEEVLPPVLVSNADHLEVERLRVAHLGAERTPLVLLGVGVREVDKVADALRKVVHRIERRELGSAELARDAREADGERLRADVLGEAEVFVVAESERLPVAPYVPDRLAALKRADRALPVEPALEAVAFRDASAREA